MTALLLAKHRQRGTQYVPHPDDLDVEHVANLAGTRLLHGSQVAVAGIVDDHVDAAEALRGLADSLPDLLVITQIDSQWRQPRSVEAVTEGCQQPLRGTGRRGDLVATPEQLRDQLQAQTAGSTGHEPRRGSIRRETHGGPSLTISVMRLRAAPVVACFKRDPPQTPVGAYLAPCGGAVPGA